MARVENSELIQFFKIVPTRRATIRVISRIPFHIFIRSSSTSPTLQLKQCRPESAGCCSMSWQSSQRNRAFSNSKTIGEGHDRSQGLSKAFR